MATQQAKPSWVSNMEKQKYGRELSTPAPLTSATSKIPEVKTSPAPAKTTLSPTPAPNTNGSNIPNSLLGTAPQMTIPQPANTLQSVPNWTTKQNELFGRLESALNTPFMYNPESDPAYQAQRQLAKLRAGDASRQAMEIANEKGILGSSMTGEQLAQIQQRAEQEAAAYIPQYRAEAYGQYQDRLRNIGELLGTARNFGQDAFNQNVTMAGLTGRVMSDTDRAAQPLLQELVSLGNQYGTATKERQAELSSRANAIRAQLAEMGIDPTLYDPNLSTEQRIAAVNRLGTPTLAAQELAYNQQTDQRNFEFQKAQQEWENMFAEKQFEESKAARLWEQAFQEKNFEQQMKEAAASRGLQWANLNQRQKEFIADQEYREKQFQYQQQQDSRPDLNKAFDDLSKIYVYDDPITGVPSITNPTALRAAIIGMGLSDPETDQMLLRFGLQPN